MNNDQVRHKLITVLQEHGVKINFIAKQLDWNYRNLVNFKNGHRDYSIARLEELDSFLNSYK